MTMLNTAKEYGALTKVFHWMIVIFFALQYFSGHVMLSMDGGAVLGLSQSNYFNWHKTVGLIVLGVTILRLINRSVTRLPDWAPSLSGREKRIVHGYEKLLYLAMLVMPISGYVYVMAGGYGVHFFEMIHLPNPIGVWKDLAVVARWTHILCGWVIVGALATHLFVVFRQQFILKNDLLRRMAFGRGEKA